MKASLIAMSAVASFFCIVGAPQSHAEQVPACTPPALARGEACTGQAGIDANTFIVQPPAVVTWTVAAPDALLAVIPTTRTAASTH